MTKNLFYSISFCFRQISHRSKSPCNRCNEISLIHFNQKKYEMVEKRITAEFLHGKHLNNSFVRLLTYTVQMNSSAFIVFSLQNKTDKRREKTFQNKTLTWFDEMITRTKHGPYVHVWNSKKIHHVARDGFTKCQPDHR